MPLLVLLVLLFVSVLSHVSQSLSPFPAFVSWLQFLCDSWWQESLAETPEKRSYISLCSHGMVANMHKSYEQTLKVDRYLDPDDDLLHFVGFMLA